MIWRLLAYLLYRIPLTHINRLYLYYSVIVLSTDISERLKAAVAGSPLTYAVFNAGVDKSNDDDDQVDLLDDDVE